MTHPITVVVLGLPSCVNRQSKLGRSVLKRSLVTRSFLSTWLAQRSKYAESLTDRTGAHRHSAPSSNLDCPLLRRVHVYFIILTACGRACPLILICLRPSLKVAFPDVLRFTSLPTRDSLSSSLPLKSTWSESTRYFSPSLLTSVH